MYIILPACVDNKSITGPFCRCNNWTSFLGLCLREATGAIVPFIEGESVNRRRQSRTRGITAAGRTCLEADEMREVESRECMTPELGSGMATSQTSALRVLLKARDGLLLIKMSFSGSE